MTTAVATSTRFSTREEWLVAAIDAMGRTIFKAADIDLPAIRVSVGWPGGTGRKNNVVGQCWPRSLSEDGVNQLFVSPVLNDGARVLDVLAHELIHAVDDCQHGHKAPFAKLAKSIGLTGKMTATAASPDLVEKLTALAEELGLYPHSPLAHGRGADSPKKQGTRMVKVECPADGYTLRTTRKWLEVGLPTCPCGTQMVAEIPDEDGDE
jgi:hypothetical protein